MLPNIYTRDEFVSIIDRMTDTRDFTRMTDRALVDARSRGIPTAPDFFSLSAVTSGWEQELVDAMSRMFMDDGEGGMDGTLSWWLYELDFGRDWKPGLMSYRGEDVDLHDAGALYDFLVRQMGDKLAEGRGDAVVGFPDAETGDEMGTNGGENADAPDFPDYADGSDAGETGAAGGSREVDWVELTRMAKAGCEARSGQPTFVPDGTGGWKVNPDAPDDRLIPTCNGWMRKGEANLGARAGTTDRTDGAGANAGHRR